MSNLNLTIDYVDVPGCSMLIEDTYAEWLRLGEVDRAAELVSDDEAAARQQQRGDTAGAWPGYTDAPYPPRERAADLAVGTTAGAARPRSEEERQVGNVRLNSDSSGLSPYSSSRDEEDIARRVHGVERRRGGCGSALASATRPATPRRGGRHRTAPRARPGAGAARLGAGNAAASRAALGGGARRRALQRAPRVRAPRRAARPTGQRGGRATAASLHVAPVARSP